LPGETILESRIYILLVVVVVVLSACNNRSRGRVRDGAIVVDSSVGDTSAGDTSRGDSSTSDSAITDSGPGVDTGLDTGTDTGPAACPISEITTGTGAPLVEGTTVGAGMDHAGGCGGGSAPEAIIQWTAPSSGTFTIDTIGSDFDTVLYVRAADCNGAEVACDDDGAASTQSMLTITATGGQTYYIFVDGFSGTGNFMLSITDGVPTP
jgi:hypothetical protein